MGEPQLQFRQSDHAFAVGYHDLHPDPTLNYQMNRFSDGSDEMAREMAAAALRIHNYTDYTRTFLGLSDAAYSAHRVLHSALYLRSAEFFMGPHDARKAPARRTFIERMRDSFHVTESSYHLIPYRDGDLAGYRLSAQNPRATVLMFGGFDSYVEEMFAWQLHLVANGYDVISFDGPGQGFALEESGIPMTEEWHRPVAAVINHFAVRDVTLFGISLGGCLAIRGAARDPRVLRVVCDDILTDFTAVCLRQLRPAKRAALRALMAMHARSAVNTLIDTQMKRSLVTQWGVQQGIHVTGTGSSYDFLRSATRLETLSISDQVTQDVLLMAAEEDHYVPGNQFIAQLGLLSQARSVTGRLFTRAEQAQNHVQVGNVGLALDVFLRWMAGLDDRDERLTSGARK
ncbi:alpha/beta fold hydrolase [Arthrobacter sp. FW306-05-C]|uniref:alpha/beta hydrolase n=1 Tax=Arthrobacter sp. FW306-05-C TaxID=2879620 RepID=UPI001F16ED56|nr:alpha/beta fold hydrolase [Arthrobacter sp. FW306-05-C]UKA68458.1 alpha/beta fold hydrolase [Arthrobacter sp. FW306-05-C]